jgi:hypothetical protein
VPRRLIHWQCFGLARCLDTVDDPQIEITLTTILAYGSYLLAYNSRLSGVIATASAGLVLGNFGAKKGMSERTRTSMQSFWEYVSFVMNSLIFLLIGLEIHVHELRENWTSVLLAIGAVLVGRVLSVYLLFPVSNWLYRANPSSVAACRGVGRPSRSSGPCSGPELEQHVSVQGRNLEVDLRRSDFLDPGSGPDNAPARSNSPYFRAIGPSSQCINRSDRRVSLTTS